MVTKKPARRKSPKRDAALAELRRAFEGGGRAEGLRLARALESHDPQDALRIIEELSSREHDASDNDNATMRMLVDLARVRARIEHPRAPLAPRSWEWDWSDRSRAGVTAAGTLVWWWGVDSSHRQTHEQPLPYFVASGPGIDVGAPVAVIRELAALLRCDSAPWLELIHERPERRVLVRSSDVDDQGAADHGASFETPAKSWAAFVRDASSADVTERRLAVIALGAFPGDDIEQVLLDVCVEDGEPTIRYSAYHSLLRVRGIASEYVVGVTPVDTLRRAIIDSPERAVRALAIASLRALLAELSPRY